MGSLTPEIRRRIVKAYKKGYKITIIHLDIPYEVCLERLLKRQNHPTISTEKTARIALGSYFKNFENILEMEADIMQKIMFT